MRDKKFFLDGIKMDLYRIVTATGNLSQEIPQQSVQDFFNHLFQDMEKINLSEREKILKQELQLLEKQFPHFRDLRERLRWTEKVLTIRCRL